MALPSKIRHPDKNLEKVVNAILKELHDLRRGRQIWHSSTERIFLAKITGNDLYDAATKNRYMYSWVELVHNDPGVAPTWHTDWGYDDLATLERGRAEGDSTTPGPFFAMRMSEAENVATTECAPVATNTPVMMHEISVPNPTGNGTRYQYWFETRGGYFAFPAVVIAPLPAHGGNYTLRPVGGVAAEDFPAKRVEEQNTGCDFDLMEVGDYVIAVHNPVPEGFFGLDTDFVFTGVSWGGP